MFRYGQVVIALIALAPLLVAAQQSSSQAAGQQTGTSAIFEPAKSDASALAKPNSSSQPVLSSPEPNGRVSFTRKFGNAGETIEFKDGKLTLRVLNRAIDTIVGLITVGSQIPIIDIQGALQSRKVSFDFHDMPLDEALKLVLKDYDTFFLYSSQGPSPTLLRHVWVYPKGQGQSFDPVPFEACASSKELRAAVHTKDVATKGRALENLLAREGDKARDVVTQLISSGAPEDRNLGLYYAGQNGIDLPASTLSYLALDDSSAANRVMALGALSGAGADAVEPVAKRALDDPDPAVREEAKEILEGLHPSLRPQVPGQGQQSHQ